MICLPTGYANEVGESFRALVPVSLVWGSYIVSTAYVTADAVDKGKKAAMVGYMYAILTFFKGHNLKYFTKEKKANNILSFLTRLTEISQERQHGSQWLWLTRLCGRPLPQ